MTDVMIQLAFIKQVCQPKPANDTHYAEKNEKYYAQRVIPPIFYHYAPPKMYKKSMHKKNIQLFYRRDAVYILTSTDHHETRTH